MASSGIAQTVRLSLNQRGQLEAFLQVFMDQARIVIQLGRLMLG